MKTATRTSNRLINEKSPYLLQHAHNPVEWYPWGDEAFKKAKKEDKPVFLSIGYSTCHWCHVMERESFEDEEVATVLNEHFVSIKVDREERPDIDTIYMSVCQAMTGHGGWPLTVVMTPDKKPFFAGTYFPKNNARGMPGLISILQRIAHLWQNNKDELIASGDKIIEAVETSYFAHNKGEANREVLDRAFDYYEQNFDSRYGGFGRAPKFPTPHNLSFLLRYWKMTGDAAALEMVEKTLDAMYRGGIYDHIGFGFTRYSTDRQWLVPHFEKMLYDNALLAIAYLETYQATGKEQYARVAREIFTYVLRDMTSPEGAFYSAEDADSEGEEGKFYVWTPEEVKEVLGSEEGERFCRAFDITPRGNFEGKSIPNLIETGLVTGFGEAGEKLFRHREKRVHPFKDDKILTAWNGLMITAMAFGARVLQDDRYAAAAEKAAQFIMGRLRREDGRLLARYRDGEAAYPAYVDDYAFLIWGLIELSQATFKPDFLKQALELNSDMLKFFWDEEHGGLYQYGSDAETLISRPKEIYDGAMPSGNSVAAVNLLRLARLTGDTGLEETAVKQLRAFGGTVSETPPGHAHFLMAVYLNETSPVEVTIVGDPGAADTREMVNQVKSGFRPETLLTVKATGKAGEELTQLAPYVAERQAVDGKATAYVCKDFACQAPVTNPQELARLLE
ncbi:MAG: thioredoxin domain-containing protein [Bacillota bacterium]